MQLENSLVEHYRRVAVVDDDADEVKQVKDPKNPNIKKAFVFEITEEDNKKYPALTIGKSLVIYVDGRNRTVSSEVE